MASISDYKLLTIVIPTFNRCEQIKENISLTIPQVMEYQDKVRIYVSDNASTDGTSEMIQDYLEKYPENIFYFCQPQNITASPNFNHAVHAVNSEYVYILGDDDLLFPNFIQTVLNLIKQNPEIGLFHFNYLFGYANLNKCKLMHENLYFTHSDALKKYQNGHNFIQEHLNGPSFISSNLFKRSLWINGTEYVKEDCSGYVWFSILLYGSLDYPCAYYPFPLLIQRFPIVAAYSKNWPLYYIVGLGNLFEYLDEKCPGIYDEWIDFSQRKHLKELLCIISEIVYNRSFYKKNRSSVKKYVRNNFLVYMYFSACLLPMPQILMGKVAPFFVKLLSKSKQKRNCD